MDLIGIVKDSFEAIAQEVGTACQRPSSTAVDDEHQLANSPATVRPGQQADRASAVVSAAARNKDGAKDSEPIQDLGEDAGSASPEQGDVSSTSDDPKLSTQSNEFPDQLKLLADVMQQASCQLSAAAVEQKPEAEAVPPADTTAELQAEQVALRKLFESRIHSDEVQARALERLHNELQASRKQLQRSEMAPLLKDIIFCQDFVTRELERDEESTSSADWRKSFEVLGQMLLDVLFKYDVEPFRSDSAEFDRSMQQCVRTENTTDEDQDRQIATCGLIGFRTEERILRREQVTVYRYRPSG